MVLVADAVLASAVSLWSTLFQTIMAASVRLGRCPRHALANGCSWKNFLSSALAWFALGIWCIISVVLVLAVTDLGVWVLLLSLESGIFRRCLFSWVQCLVRQWIQFMRVLWLLDVFHTFSTWRRTRFLKRCFSIRFEWRSVPSGCFGCSLALRGSHFETLEVLFMSFTG